MAHKLSPHTFQFRTFSLQNRFPSPKLPLDFLAPSLLNKVTVHSNQCLTASIRRRIGFVTARVDESKDDIDEMREGCDEDEKKELAEQSVWVQMKEIVKFTGPAAGLWLCAPLMSLIDTAVVGHGSSLELAALGMHSHPIFFHTQFY
ncbi:hypothetical protein SESBI_01598 [Sesbania bispinosa]|nr:hypothetical protein SESBI_01598 [Sesbania bispinosa]